MEEMSLSSGSPSLVDYERSSKRRRSDTSCSSGYQTPGSSSLLGIERETIRLKRELEAVRRQLTQMENTVSEHVEIRERIIKVSENEKDVLKSQLQEARQTIEELQKEVEITRRAQAAVEVEFSRAKTRMQLQIAVLVENAKAKDNTIYSSFEGDEELLRCIKTEQELIADGDEYSEDNSRSNAKNNEEEASEPQMANDRLSSVNGAITEGEERVFTTPKDTNKTSRRNAQQLIGLNRKISDFFSKTDSYQLRLSGNLSPALEQRISCPQAPSSRAPSANLSLNPGDITYSPERGQGRNNEDQRTEGEQQKDGLELVHTGKYYAYLVSNQFFDLDWDGEYTRKEKKWVCKRCRRAFPSKTVLKDHVWVKHHDGIFLCPHCPNRYGKLKSRSNIHMHVQMRHPELYHSKAFRQNIRRTL